MCTPISCLDTLQSHVDGGLDAELRVVRMRTQAALVRTLADQVELLASRRHAAGLSEQLIEEMMRLGCRLFEEAAEVSRWLVLEDRGIASRRPAILTIDAQHE